MYYMIIEATPLTTIYFLLDYMYGEGIATKD